MIKKNMCSYFLHLAVDCPTPPYFKSDRQSYCGIPLKDKGKLSFNEAKSECK